jgi:serine phosphatase RsbU (regulator of sigma subunit)
MAAILIADDDNSILLLLSKVLGSSEHELILVDDGKEAIKHIKEKQFDLIISDLQMPEVNGIDVLQAGKKKNSETEVLILTGHGSVKSAVRAMKLGAYEYLTKPVDVEELRLKVAQALNHRQLKIEIERQQRKIEEYNEMIQRDLKLAEQVQQSLVPLPISNSKIDIGLKHLPMIGVGGDFADIYYDGEQFIYITMIDITGHGITAALLVNRICSEIRSLVRDEFEPNEILYNLNNFVIDIFHRTGMFLTMFTSKLDLNSTTFTYAGSSHPALILWKQNAEKFQKLSSQNMIIGFEKQPVESFSQDTVQLDSGDRLFFYTDGIIEAENETREQFGIKRLLFIIDKLKQKSSQEIADTVVTYMQDQKFTQVRDDIFIIVGHVL